MHYNFVGVSWNTEDNEARSTVLRLIKAIWYKLRNVYRYPIRFLNALIMAVSSVEYSHSYLPCILIIVLPRRLADLSNFHYRVSLGYSYAHEGIILMWYMLFRLACFFTSVSTTRGQGIIRVVDVVAIFFYLGTGSKYTNESCRSNRETQSPGPTYSSIVVLCTILDIVCACVR